MHADVVALSWNRVPLQGHCKSHIHLYTYMETFGWIWARLDQGERSCEEYAPKEEKPVPHFYTKVE